MLSTVTGDMSARIWGKRLISSFNFSSWQESHKMISGRGQSKQTGDLIFQASLKNRDNEELFETMVNFQITFIVCLEFFPKEHYLGVENGMLKGKNSSISAFSKNGKGYRIYIYIWCKFASTPPKWSLAAVHFTAISQQKLSYVYVLPSTGENLTLSELYCILNLPHCIHAVPGLAPACDSVDLPGGHRAVGLLSLDPLCPSG